MNILINCSNLKKGGGLQVADSICCKLNQFSNHKFIVVLSSQLAKLGNTISSYPNVTIFNYNIENSFKTLLTGRNIYLDEIVEQNKVDVVFTIFGPITWSPKCPHLLGFARAQLLLEDSPFYKRMNYLQQIQNKLINQIKLYFFRRGVTAFFTENEYISNKWQLKVKKRQKVYTVTNFYNQIYDNPKEWIQHKIPDFKGCTLLCITANYPHKNLEIAIDVAKILRKKYPNFQFRFAFTINKDQYPQLPKDLEEHFYFIGSVSIQECPSLYQQSDIMFQPTLLECFTATYPEAMHMKIPIVTTNLEFAKTLCGDAALYYDPLNAQSAADAIYNVMSDNNLRNLLIKRGVMQLQNFDTYEQRITKLIKILENIN